MSAVLIAGCNRGGSAVVDQMPPTTAASHEWIFVDPKPGRARHLSEKLRARDPQFRTTAIQTVAQQAMARVDDEGAFLFTMDSVADTVHALRARRPAQCATFQLCGRGQGGSHGARIALQGTIVPGDRQRSEQAMLILGTLDGMSRRASSRVLTRPDLLMASVLKPLRNQVTTLTVKHLSERNRDPFDLSGGPMSVILAGTTYPLVVVRAPASDRFPDWRERALHGVGELPKPVHVRGVDSKTRGAVAVVVPELSAVHFLVVSIDQQDGRRLETLSSLELPPPIPESLLRRKHSAVDTAIFTD